MSTPAPRNKAEAARDKLAGSGAIVGLDDLVDLLNSPKRLGLMRFYSGLMAGIGGVLGAAVIVVVLGVAVKYLHGAPVIGHLLQEIGDAAHAK